VYACSLNQHFFQFFFKRLVCKLSNKQKLTKLSLPLLTKEMEAKEKQKLIANLQQFAGQLAIINKKNCLKNR